jgi:hypothetical protein
MSDQGIDVTSDIKLTPAVEEQKQAAFAAGEATVTEPGADQATPAAKKSKPVKKANKPFLVHQRWLAKQELEKREQEQRRRDGGSIQSSDGGGVGAGWHVMKWVLLALLTSAMMSRSVTGTWGWGYEGKWSHWSNVS